MDPDGQRTAPDGARPGTVEFTGPAWPSMAPADRAWVADAVMRVVAILGRPVGRAAVEVVGDARMAELHARHMGLASTTDVLTFASNGPDGPIDVDIAVCMDEARRRGDGTPHGMRGELLLYVLHGLLHAAGHDDLDDESFARMHAEEDRILEAAGFGRIFEEGSR